MIIFAENPTLKSEDSQILENPAGLYEITPDRDFSPFTDQKSIDEIESRLYGMEWAGIHIANEDGVAYHSGKLAEIVGMIRDTGHPTLFTTLPHQYGLREAVLNILKKEMMKGSVSV